MATPFEPGSRQVEMENVALRMGPGICEPIAFRPRVVWIQHELTRSGDPCAARDRRHSRSRVSNVCQPVDVAGTLGSNDGSRAAAPANLHPSLDMQRGHSGRTSRGRWRPVCLPGPDRRRVRPERLPVLVGQRSGELAEREVTPFGMQGALESPLLVGRGKSRHTCLGDRRLAASGGPLLGWNLPLLSLIHI